jgi:hypothetical protein
MLFLKMLFIKNNKQFKSFVIKKSFMYTWEGFFKEDERQIKHTMTPEEQDACIQ